MAFTKTIITINLIISTFCSDLNNTNSGYIPKTDLNLYYQKAPQEDILMLNT